MYLRASVSDHDQFLLYLYEPRFRPPEHASAFLARDNSIVPRAVHPGATRDNLLPWCMTCLEASCLKQFWKTEKILVPGAPPHGTGFVWTIHANLNDVRPSSPSHCPLCNVDLTFSEICQIPRTQSGNVELHFTMLIGVLFTNLVAQIDSDHKHQGLSCLYSLGIASCIAWRVMREAKRP